MDSGWTPPPLLENVQKEAAFFSDYFPYQDLVPAVLCRICKETSRILIGIEILAIGHFCGTKILGGGSQLDRLLLELDDWITAGQVSAGAGTEARGDWIRGKWKEVVEF